MTLSYTPRFHLAVPDFLSEPWHAEFAAAMESIDQALYTAIVAQETSPWVNDHSYVLGDIVIDPSTGTLYAAAKSHTSSSVIFAPTFTDELLAHPTYWTSFAVIAASQAEAEQGTDNNKYMTPLRTAQAITAQSPTPGIATQTQAQEGTDNTQIMTPLRVSQATTARIATQAQAVAGTDNTVLMTPLRVSQQVVATGVAGGDTVGFSAHKNGVNQTGIASNVATKVTFGTELYDMGSFYDTSNSRWTPPSGQIHIDGAIFSNTTIDPVGTNYILSVYKNGALFKQGRASTPVTFSSGSVRVNIDDIANGTDYYELFVTLTSTGTGTIDGATSISYFMGSFLGEVGTVTLGLAEIGFRATKGGTVQTGFPNATWTKLTFPTEDYDQGARYDPATSRWTPPTGLVHITTAFDATGSIAVGGQVNAAVYKNGTILKNSISTSSSGSLCGTSVSVDDVASGTDYYEAFAYIQTGGATQIDGTVAQTFFTGHRITGAQGEVGPIGLTGPSGSVSTPITNAGRLLYASPTQLSFKPFNGDRIKINGVSLQIPTSGVVGLTNTGAYVNGSAGQSLAASTRYYVYVFSNAGILTADFSTTGHSSSVSLTNEGTEIKTGDDTRTLIGMIYTGGTGAVQFVDNATQRFVLSWFNRRARNIQGPGTNTYIGAFSWSAVNGASFVYFLTWADEACEVGAMGYGWPNDTGALTFYGGVAIDQLQANGTGLLSYSYVTSPNPGWSQCVSTIYMAEFAEGLHTLLPAGYSTGYTLYLNIWMVGMIRG